MQGGALSGNLASAAWQLVKEQGVKALYKGLGPSSDVIANAIGFTLYDSISSAACKLVGGRQLNAAEKGISSAVSACVCMTLQMPIEVVMTRMRLQGVGGNPVLYKNGFDCLKQLIQSSLAAGWKGIGTAYGKVFPQLFMCYGMYALLSKQLAIGGLKSYDGAKK